MLGSDNEFFLKTTNSEVFDRILVCLNYFIRNSRGRKENLIGVSLREDFYKVSCKFIVELFHK